MIGAFGPKVDAMLVVADLKRCMPDEFESLEKPTRTIFAAVEQLNSNAFDVILTAETGRTLREIACYTVLKLPCIDAQTDSELGTAS